MTHDYSVILTYEVQVSAPDKASAEQWAIEDVEHGRFNVRAVDVTERDTTKGCK